MTKWTADQIGDLKGRIAIVTGANTGIGYVTALELARHGAHVVAAARSEERGRAAVERMRAENLAGTVDFAQLDLADLASVKAFVADFAAEHDRLDLLINNAGVMMPPERRVTKDGHELQIGTNHFGHFALTGLLFPLILATPGARVVTVSSMAHRGGSIDFDDLHSERKRYERMATYGQSKLANLLFARELDRRLRKLGADAASLAAHPGWTATDLQRHTLTARILNPIFSQRPAQGALPTLYAATSPDADGGDYIGPDGWAEMRGHPVKVGSNAESRDQDVAERLWKVSEEATGIVFKPTLAVAA